jgi:DsbC/DsbD-like thiol-disulfide interchange protein
MKFFLLTILLLSGFACQAQNKLSWTYSFDKESNEVILHGEIEEGWHLYSQILKNDVGPVPTTITFEPNKSVKLIGEVRQPQPVVAYDENFGAELDFFEKEVTFRQTVHVKKPTQLRGMVTYMVCDDQKCLPPIDVHFEIQLTK